MWAPDGPFGSDSGHPLLGPGSLKRSPARSTKRPETDQKCLQKLQQNCSKMQLKSDRECPHQYPSRSPLKTAWAMKILPYMQLCGLVRPHLAGRLQAQRRAKNQKIADEFGPITSKRWAKSEQMPPLTATPGLAKTQQNATTDRNPGQSKTPPRWPVSTSVGAGRHTKIMCIFRSNS